MKAPHSNFTVLSLAVVCILIPLGQNAAAQTCVPPPAGLVSWYPGEGNADDQQNASDGILQGGTTFVSGKIGQAFNFDGVNDSVSVPDISAARAPTFTVEGWFNLRQAPPVGNEYYLASKYTGFAGWIFRIGNDLKPGFSIHRQPSTQVHAGSSVAIPLNTWVHIAATYDGSTAKLYINGVLRGSVAFSGGYTPFSGDMKIGTASWFTGGFMPGGADEVSMYSRVLSLDEIQLIVNAAATGKCKPPYNGSQGCALLRSNLTMWYPAEGKSGDVQRGRDATLVGGVTYTAGKVGQAFSFNGTSGYASLPGNSDLFTEATVEAWVRTKATSGDFQAIVSSTTSSFIHLQLNGSGSIAIYTDAGPILLQSIPQTPTGVWRHIALSVKSGNTRLYVDGNLFANSTAKYSNLISPNELRIGSGFAGGRFFNGEIDEVGIYHRALSAAEIKAIFNAGTLGKCTPACTALPLGATNWFPGEGNAQDVRGSSNGTLQNGVNFTAGKVSQSFNFNGQNYVSVPGTFGGGPETTVEGWYKTTGLTGDFQAIVSSTALGEFVHLQLSDSGNIVVHTNTGSISLGKVSPADLLSVWRHIALSVKSGDTRLYLDGQLIRASTQTFATISPTSSLRLGSGVIASGSAGRFFKGQIDEVKIYNRALSQFEIQTIYRGRSAGSCRQNAAISNNDFANAAVLNGGSGLIFGTNLAATRESNEPVHADVPGGASVWYRWQAPATGTYLFTTFGSSFDTVLAVYTGAAVNALTPIANNDDNGNADNLGPTLTSSLAFDALAGTTYYIAVDGASGRTGNIALGWGLRVTLSGQSITATPSGGGKGAVVINSLGPTVKLVGDDSRSTSAGRYSFSNLRVGGNYVLTMEAPESPAPIPRGHLYDFFPLSGDLSGADFSVSECPIGVNCKSNASGRVSNSVGAGVSGVLITISGTSLQTGTDSAGDFVLSSVPDVDYTVTPSHPDYTFSPVSVLLPGNTDSLGVDFTGQGRVTISGQTRTGIGTPIGGVTLTLGGAQAATQQSDASGHYEFRVLPGGPYTVAAAKPGVTFLQPTLTFASINANQKDADFTTPPSVSISVSPASVVEDGATNLVYTFTRTGVTSDTLTVNFSVSGTAAFSTDYAQTGAASFSATSGTVTFGAGSSTATVILNPATDAAVEPDETAILTVSSGTGYTVGIPGAATGTLTNDDTSVDISVSPVSVAEDGASNLVFTFTRTGVTSGALTVNFSVSGTAGFSTDYAQTGAASFSATSGTITIGPGSSTATVTVDPITDGTNEAIKTVVLTVTSGPGYDPGSANAATGSITVTPPTLFLEDLVNALALDSVTFLRSPFRVINDHNFSSDHRTRLILFTSDLGLTQPDSQKLTVQAFGTNLPVEAVGALNGIPGISYIIVRLPEGLATGNLPLTVTFYGVQSNSAILSIVP